MEISYIQKPPIGIQGNNKISKSLFGGQMNQKIFFFETISLSRPKLTKISLVFNQIQVYHSDLLRAIFDNLDLDYKMLINLNLFIDPKIHFLVVILALTLYPSLLNTLYDEHLLAVCTSKCTGQKLYWLKYTLNCLRFKKMFRRNT